MNPNANPPKPTTDAPVSIFSPSLVTLLVLPSLAPAAAACFGLVQDGEASLGTALFGAIGSLLTGLLSIGLGLSLMRLLAKRPRTGVPLVGRGFLAAGCVWTLNSLLSLPWSAEERLLLPASLSIGSTLAIAMLLLGVASARSLVDRAERSEPVDELDAASWFVPALATAAFLLICHHALGGLPAARLLVVLQILLAIAFGSLCFSLHDARKTRLTRLLVLSLIPLLGAALTRALVGFEGLPSLATSASMLECIAILIPANLLVAYWEGQRASRAESTGVGPAARPSARVPAAARATEAFAPAARPSASSGTSLAGRGVLDGAATAAPATPATEVHTNKRQTTKVAKAPAASASAGDESWRTDELLAILIHELNAPIRKQRQLADFLSREVGADAPAQLRAHAHEIRESALRSESIVQAVESIAIGRTRRPEQTPLRACFEQALEGFDRAATREVRSVLMAPLPMVDADRTSVVLVLKNLFLNALEHQGRLPKLRVDRVGDEVLVSLVDAQPWARLPEASFEGPLEIEATTRRGMGLRVCGCLVRSWGGQLSISEVDADTRVHLSLPVYTAAFATRASEPMEVAS